MLHVPTTGGEDKRIDDEVAGIFSVLPIRFVRLERQSGVCERKVGDGSRTREVAGMEMERLKWGPLASRHGQRINTTVNCLISPVECEEMEFHKDTWGDLISYPLLHVR